MVICNTYYLEFNLVNFTLFPREVCEIPVTVLESLKNTEKPLLKGELFKIFNSENVCGHFHRIFTVENNLKKNFSSNFSAINFEQSEKMLAKNNKNFFILLRFL